MKFWKIRQPNNSKDNTDTGVCIVAARWRYANEEWKTGRPTHQPHRTTRQQICMEYYLIRRRRLLHLAMYKEIQVSVNVDTLLRS